MEPSFKHYKSQKSPVEIRVFLSVKLDLDLGSMSQAESSSLPHKSTASA